LGGKIWVTNIGGAKILRKYVFRQHSKKFFEKIPFYSQEPFLDIDNFFQKFTLFIQNLLLFLCIFLSLSLFLLSFMSFFFEKLKKLKILV